MLNYFFTPQAGGIAYHLKARRYSSSLWEPFRRDLSEILLQNLPSKIEHGILVGPSGGYCFKPEFLNRFNRLTVFDPDQRAERIFRKNFPELKEVQWNFEDAFNFPELGRFTQLEKTYNKSSDSVLIFCNVLGQIPFLTKSPFKNDSLQLREWQSQLLQFIKPKKWLSFHDRLSGPFVKNHFQLHVAGSILNTDICTQVHWDSNHVIDHLTGDLFPGRTRYLLLWNISKSRSHMIEVASSYI